MRVALAIAALILVADAAAAATRPIEVYAVQSSRVDQAVGPPGRVANTSEQTWGVRSRHGRLIGRLAIECRWITSRIRLCHGEIRLPLGTLIVAGSSRTPFSGMLAVTGGTRLYRGAAGEVSFVATGRGRMTLNVALT